MGTMKAGQSRWGRCRGDGPGKRPPAIPPLAAGAGRLGAKDDVFTDRTPALAEDRCAATGCDATRGGKIEALTEQLSGTEGCEALRAALADVDPAHVVSLTDRMID